MDGLPTVFHDREKNFMYLSNFNFESPIITV